MSRKLPDLLTSAERACLADIAETLGLAPDQVWEVPAVMNLFRPVVGVRLAKRYEEEEGLSRSRALQRAATELGLGSSTLTTWLWRSADRDS